MRVTCRYLRKAPLASGPLHSRWASCCVRNQGLTRGRREYILMPLLRGVHDSVMSAIEIGGWITGKHPLPVRSRRAERTADGQSCSSQVPTTRNFQSSASSQCWELPPSKAPTSDPDAEANLSEQLRSVFRLLTNPIVVCTATHEGVPRAMTMSSFTSLTLWPMPLVSFNIATPSRTLDAIMASREFNIHVLAGDASGAAVADHFTRGNTDGVFDTMKGATYSVGERGSAPLIRGRGVLRALRCRLLRDEKTDGLVRVRDHVIVVGEVVEMIPVTKVKEFGLAYADRRYRQVGGLIEDE
ncbi:hypothetical protein E4U43_007912 [Claviceps pusilla]|uniref:Flavin reductase like domain-containing protein n=1 Tax=Claviceps pusilla TaxID=123648 RepID=A0A9P7T052_9HYPO|nr:hypothetical protein E4U43_007912 [Claviceps pusilla]